MRGLTKFLRPYIQNAMLRSVSDKIRRRGLLAYLRAIQGARRGLLALVLLALLLQTMMLGLFGAAVLAVLLYVPDPADALFILMCVSGGFFVVPMLALLVGFSDRLWYRLSGAKKWVAQSLPPPQKRK